MTEELKTPRTKENPDWFDDGYPALQTEMEIIHEEDVSISTTRYETLIRAEHTVELIKKAYTDKALKYNHERATVVKLLLGMETDDE